MNLAAVFKPFLRPPDMRPAKQIESELDEEFAFHIKQIERELCEADHGISHEEASRRAHARFGDVETLKKRCKRIAMEERIMLQRINAILMVFVLIAIAVMSAQMWSNNRATLHSLSLLNAHIEQMRLDATAVPPTMRRSTTAPDSAVQIRVVPLSHVYAQSAQHALRTIYDSATITADLGTNSLVISAPAALHKDILDTIAQLDRAAGPGDEILVYEAQPAAARPGLFYMSGAVLQKTGAIAIPDVGHLTLRRAIEAAGGLVADDTSHSDALIVLHRSDGTRVFKGTWQELREGNVDPTIEPYDFVEVSMRNE